MFQKASRRAARKKEGAQEGLKAENARYLVGRNNLASAHSCTQIQIVLTSSGPAQLEDQAQRRLCVAAII